MTQAALDDWAWGQIAAVCEREERNERLARMWATGGMLVRTEYEFSEIATQETTDNG